MAAALFLPHAGGPFTLLRASRFAPWAAPVPRRRLLSGPPTAGEPSPPAHPPISKLAEPPVVGTPEPLLLFRTAEAEILRDIDPVVQLIKDILHSDRYGDGECLCPKDENVVVEKLLSYHPRALDKIGCGLDAIMGTAYIITGVYHLRTTGVRASLGRPGPHDQHRAAGVMDEVVADAA